MVGYYGVTLAVHVSVHPSLRPSVVRPSVCPYFRFWIINSVNVNGFSPNSVYALILWSSGLGLVIGKFRLFLTELSVRDTSLFSFPDDNFNLVCALIL